MKEKDALRARRVLVEIGLLTEVKTLEDGEIVAELTPEEIAQYNGLRDAVTEIHTLEKMLKELKIKLNTKVMVNHAQRGTWWSNIQEKYSVKRIQALGGLHVDYTNKLLRKGISATDYSNCL